MKKKTAIVISAFLLSIISFISLYLIQKKMLNPSGFEKVYVLNKNINKGQVFSENNIDQFFKLEERDKKNITNDMVKIKEELTNTYAKEDLYENEIINKNRLGDNNKRIDEIKNKRTISLKFTDIGEVVGGILRKGDLVDIILTENNNNSQVKSQTKLKNIYISEVFSGEGTIIDNESSDQAMALNLTLSAEDGVKLDNAVNSGKIKIMRVDDESIYDDIKVENNK